MKKETDGDKEKGLEREKTGGPEEERHTKTGREGKETELESDGKATAERMCLLCFHLSL